MVEEPSRVVVAETIRSEQLDQLLLPPLPNDLFVHHISSWLCSPIHPAVLCRLRHVNRPLHLALAKMGGACVYVS
jgi:hypothetical protein